MATREVVEKFFGLLAAGDPDAVAEVFGEDIDWYVPGSPSLPWTGRRSKSSEVPGYLRTLVDNIVPEKNVDRVEALVVDGDHAVMLGRFTRVAKSTGRTYEMPIAMHFQVAGDKIVKFYLYEDTLKVSQAYAV
ncbi:nuclear transport factor 2 family protein [Actinacidiphila acidipaludis]|uniref:Nuclear transport factor 2 family protein n=1 Tax=Actinacidiphila acidipaludis TaxID=2873382 RepID=A0ABS7QC03_9ACTN|nr:nuclear transport factor 2 family protein [Streptomyces acidipaludis]MBY8880678.1 nuclear transport factor 2 family protein [Streptomyces acidipaludis]